MKRFAAVTRYTGMSLGVAAVIALGGPDSGVEGPNAVPSAASAQVVGVGVVQVGMIAA
ncbi:hypothetical protein AB0E59_19910 [Lentzea sp. NPDC034063]|uniref:hypothetical protein n=1 Tax=unclassified Lentzea TaxID=2643253 RepID=UPI0033D4E0EC